MQNNVVSVLFRTYPPSNKTNNNNNDNEDKDNNYNDDEEEEDDYDDDVLPMLSILWLLNIALFALYMDHKVTGYICTCRYVALL